MTFTTLEKKRENSALFRFPQHFSRVLLLQRQTVANISFQPQNPQAAQTLSMLFLWFIDRAWAACAKTYIPSP